mmetsp:Transcript_9068/g.16734  ORF Transcript_9068/g.16734 Transcript_9068/m.16734 type:complete len:181 (+) Transcript_9068:468-1010(+)
MVISWNGWNSGVSNVMTYDENNKLNTRKAKPWKTIKAEKIKVYGDMMDAAHDTLEWCNKYRNQDLSAGWHPRVGERSDIESKKTAIKELFQKFFKYCPTDNADDARLIKFLTESTAQFNERILFELDCGYEILETVQWANWLQPINTPQNREVFPDNIIRHFMQEDQRLKGKCFKKGEKS